jgi:hypothetical protein
MTPDYSRRRLLGKLASGMAVADGFVKANPILRSATIL